MSEKAQRAGILLITIIFIVFIVGVTVYSFIDNKKTQNKINANTTANQEGKLKGTQLQNFEPIAKVDELKTITIQPGQGDAVVKDSDTVTVHYTGALANSGKIFESSLDSGQPATFPLSGVIAGWTKGIPGMKVGETRRLIIPSSLAYGASGAGSDIGPNADLVFDVTLVKIN